MVGAIKEPFKITTIISNIPRMRKVKNNMYIVNIEQCIIHIYYKIMNSYTYRTSI